MAVCDIGTDCFIVYQTGCWCSIVNDECLCDCVDGMAGHRERLNIESGQVISICMQGMALSQVHDLLTDIGTMNLKSVPDGREGDIVNVKYESMKFSEIAEQMGF